VEDGLTSFELLLYNAVLSLPVLSVTTLATGEAQVSFPQLLDKGDAPPACKERVICTVTVLPQCGPMQLSSEPGKIQSTMLETQAGRRRTLPCLFCCLPLFVAGALRAKDRAVSN